MVREGMLKDASDLLADARTDPQAANPYYQKMLEGVQNQIAFAKGDMSSAALVYGLDPKPSKGGSGTAIFWQISPGTKTRDSGTYFSKTAWTEGIASRPTSYRIDFSGGPDDQHLTHFLSKDNVATEGTMVLKTPPGVQVLQATLVQGKPGAPATPAPAPAPGNPAPPVAGADASGQLLLLGGAENLLKNADFQVTKDATGKASVVGWHGLMPSNVVQETGGPLGTYQTLEAAMGSFGSASDIQSDPIPLKPNTSYALGCWVRLAGNIGVRYLDASGKVLNPNQYLGGGNDEEWQWRTWLINGDSRSIATGEQVPPNAASFMIVMRINQDTDLAGFSVRVWPASSPAPNPPAK
jgi:hypothetical protein